MTQRLQKEDHGDMVSDVMNAVCQNIPVPCLILSKSQTVLAANDGMCRLTLKSSDAGSQHTLIGKAIRELGLITAPAQSLRYRDVEELLDDCQFDRHSTTIQQSGAEDHDYATEADFWDREDQAVCGNLDVIVPREGPIQGGKQSTKLKQIHAQMSVRHLRLGDDPMYMITFERSRSGQIESPPQRAVKKPRTSNISNEGDRVGQILPQDSQGIISQVIPYSTATFDADGQALEFSQPWLDFFNITKEETLGTGWVKVMHPEDVEIPAAARTEAIEKNAETWSQEARYRTKDGSYRWFIIRATSSKNDDGSVARWHVSMMDIDELVKSRKEAEDWMGSTRTLIANTDVCLWGLTPDRTVYLKEGSLSWDPVSALELRSEDVDSVPDPKDHLRYPAPINSVKNAVDAVSKGRAAALRVDHKNSDRWYQSTLVADYFRSPQGGMRQDRAVLGLTIDTTDVRARAELQVENTSLVEKEKAAIRASESKSRFLANTSHELRTPIAGIIGLNHLLKESLPEKKQQEFSDSINLSAGLLLTLVNDVLDLSKIEAGRMEIETVPFRVAKLVDTIRSVMTVQADQKGLDFQCVFADVPPGIAIVGDPNRLQQVLLNLLSNSIKFTQTGSVKMSVVRVHSDEASDHDGSRPSAEEEYKSPSSDMSDTIKLEFMVEDTGCGMDTDTITKSFEAFSQANSSTARQYGGTGLGLTISRQLVDMMGGSLRLTSTPSVGTTARFQITFPLVNTSPDNEESPAMSKATSNISHEIRKAGVNVNVNTEDGAQVSKLGVASAGQHLEPGNDLSSMERSDRLVLVAEDNEVNMKIAILMIEKLGFKVISAKNGKEALNTLFSRAESNLRLPDVILMDCMMPVMDGYEATRSLRSESDKTPISLRNIPVVALTANATKGEQKKCLDAGMDDYLTKPINKAALQQTLDKWCLSGRT